jgi:hypothetical protein
MITVDLDGTKSEGLELSEAVELFDDDWFNIKATEKQLMACGDPKKLVFLLNKIKHMLS